MAAGHAIEMRIGRSDARSLVAGWCLPLKPFCLHGMSDFSS